MSVCMQFPPSLIARVLSSSHPTCILNSKISHTCSKASWLKLCIRHHGTVKATIPQSALPSVPARVGWSSGGWSRRGFMTSTRSKARNKDVAIKGKKGGKGEVTVGAKVAQAGKDTMYTGIVIVGIGVTGLMFYAVFRELFSGKSPNGVFTKALKTCLQDPEIVDELGEPIKGHGEENRRRRRRHVSHYDYQDSNGVRNMRMKFYMKGSRRRATVHLEVKENESGRFEYRYLFAELDGYPQRTIVLVDNR